MSKLIVVVGVTGAQGSSVAKKFLSLPGWRVRGISRNPLSTTSLALTGLGIEIIQGELDDATSLIPAFEGAHTIFANTNYFTHLLAAFRAPEIATGRNAKVYAHDREIEQGVNVASAASSPAVIKALERFIYSSLCNATKLSGGKYTTVYHFDSKVETIRRIRKQFPEMGHYVENWRTFGPMAPQKLDDGGYVMRRPTGKDVKWQFVVAEKDAGEFVRGLVGGPVGTKMLGVSEPMTMPEFMEIWGKVYGVKVSYEQVSYEDFFAGLPAAMAEEIGDSFKFIEEFGHCGGDPTVATPAQVDHEFKLTSMEEFIESENWSSVFGK